MHHFGIPALLIAAQPDIGTLMVFCVIFVALLFASGFELRWMFLLGGLAVAAVTPVIFYLASTNNFRWLRLVAFINPEADPYPAAVTRSSTPRLPLAPAAYTERRLAEGTLTHLNYVPEKPHRLHFFRRGRDAGVRRRAGAAGPLCVCYLRMLLLSFHTNDKFGRLIIIGVMAMLLFHVFENIGMCIGVMPITGIPLPFISYGGTNLVVNMAGIGLVLTSPNIRRRWISRSSRRQSKITVLSLVRVA